MKYLTIILLALLTACNVSDSEEETTNKKIGTWQVVSEDSATWIGEQNMSKSKADTLLISNVGEYGLNIVSFENNLGYVHLVIDDPTFIVDSTVSVPDIKFSVSILYSDTDKIKTSGGRRSFTEQGVSAEIGVTYDCRSSEKINDEILEYKITEKDSTIRLYHFVTYGFVDTIEYLSC